MSEFIYQEIFEQATPECEYRLLANKFVTTFTAAGRTILSVKPEGLSFLAEQAVRDISYLLRTSHLEGLQKIIEDPESSENDVYIAETLLENAVISAEMEYPGCQDTGTVIVAAQKGENVYTGTDDAESLSRGIYQAYQENNLRFSQTVPLSMYEEVNSGTNLPAQIDIAAVPGGSYEFLFITKGGGSANKTFLFQETKALLEPDRLRVFLAEKIASIGTSACPPYHLAVVIGGTSPEMNLKTVKLASAKYYDNLPENGNRFGRAFRDRQLETDILEMTRSLGIGAQFGGKYFCHDVRVVRLPRHGASCPVGIGVSCSADRNIRAKITADGIFLEKLETDPSRFLKTSAGRKPGKKIGEAVRIDLSAGMEELRRTLSRYPVKTRVMLNGKIIVARDIAHAKLYERLKKGEGVPEYFKEHIIYYAGPAKAPEGRASGSLGPTTAGRMDPYVPEFQKEGASLVMLAKGNRSQEVVDSCRKYGGFYLGSVGGAAAILGRDCVTSSEVVEFPELGMEAVYMITVRDLPAFILIDDKGNDFFRLL